MPYNANEEEQKILEFWKKNQIFEKSVEQRPDNKPYVFYDGPPFATGLPHYGHFPASLMKDAVPRYFTMQGYRVERRWGWDCHGLPIENIVEKELGTKSKKEIEELGVAKFNELCRSKVLGYVDEWKKTIHRLGRWVDMDNAYRTMDRDYMESVWWVFKELWDKGLIYEDYRSMHICPRCETTLSQQEVSEGYKDVKDISLVVKFRLKEQKEQYILAWTTTPWTLPGNVAVAVNPDTNYVRVRIYSPIEKKNIIVILAQDVYTREVSLSTKQSIFWSFEHGNPFYKELKEYEGEFPANEIIGEPFKGSEIVGVTYESLFPYYKDTKNAFRVVAGDFVSTEEGTGIVHIAPAFGDDDFKVGKREGIPLVQHVSMDGRFKPEVTDFAGQEVKPRSDDDKTRLSADIAIIKYLQDKGLFFSKQNIVHSYPHCWRCDTPLLNYATSSWFVKVTAVKEKALTLAKKINWSPEHIKEGRFGKWLEGARDWSISRQRFWASVMPVWQCEGNKETGKLGNSSCDNVRVFGSVAELEKLSGQKVSDLHKHIVDSVTFPCEKCGGTMKRIPDVLDTWFDSGSMPYAQAHYPFENKKKFEDSFPAEFIAEGQDQTRSWFYYLHVLGTALFKSIAFENVIVNGIVLAEDGKKMSKKLKNYPDPNILLEKYGADALRYYLLSSPVVHAESLNLSETGVRETYNKVVNMLWNVFEFYNLYADRKSDIGNRKSDNVLDRWIIAKLNSLVKEVTENMNGYRLAEACRPIGEFITELSQWYVRRSRDRFKSDDAIDKQAALATLREVLLTLSKVMAPFTPFIVEKIYKDLGGELESVHLETWPKAEKKLMNEKILEEMNTARKIVEMGLSKRAETGMKVRQPLSSLMVQGVELSDELKEIIADELNVKNVGTKKGKTLEIALDVVLTDELKKEGLLRELVRAINNLRKEQKLTIQDKITFAYKTDDALLQSVFTDFAEEIKRQVLAKEITSGGSTEVEVDGRTLHVSLTNPS